MIKIINKYSKEVVGLGFFLFLGLMMSRTIFEKKVAGIHGITYLVVRLKTAEGLKIGSPVSIDGVSSGSLSYLHYAPVDTDNWPIPYPEYSTGREDPPAGQTVMAVLAMNQDIVLYSNYKIISRYTSALSEKQIELIPGRLGPDTRLENMLELNEKELIAFRKTGILPNKSGVTLARASNYDDPLYSIATVIVENRKSIRRITHNLAEVTDKINRGNGTIAALVNRPDFMNSTNGLLKNVIILVREISDGVEDTRESRATIDFLQSLITITFAALSGAI